MIDWTSPRSLATSTIWNTILSRQRTLGHVAVELSCKKEYVLTGQTGDTSKRFSLLLGKGYGLGILFHKFPGRLETEELLSKEILRRFKENDNLAAVTFKLQEPTCQALIEYFRDFKSRNVQKYYGLDLRPLHQEGAGCSAFAMSFLKVGNLMLPDFFQYWSYELNIPKELVGGPKTQQRVSIWKLILPWINHSWLSPDEKNGVPIFFWDPDSMYRWTQKMAKKNRLSENMKVERIGKIINITYDMRERKLLTQSYWKNGNETQR